MFQREAIHPGLSAMWLIPQGALFGQSEAFATVGKLEFYYKQTPENMRSLAGSLVFLGMSAGGYLSRFMVNTVHKTTCDGGHANWLSENLDHGRLDLFYYMLTGLSVGNFICFLVFAKAYKYKAEDHT